MKRYAGRGVDISRRGGLARGAAGFAGAIVACSAGADFGSALVATSHESQAQAGRKNTISSGSVFMAGGRVEQRRSVV